MVRIVKENADMLVSEEDFELIYRVAGWKVVEGAPTPVTEDTTRRIHVDPSTELVAGPTALELEGTHEGETILEDENERRTKAGKEVDADKPTVSGKVNQAKNTDYPRK